MDTKATKKLWRGKQLTHDTRVIIEFGEVISVDQLVSPTLGFIDQTNGRLTTKSYRYATIFGYQTSKIRYVCLWKTNNVIETLETKAAFQHHNHDKGVVIKAYRDEARDKS